MDEIQHSYRCWKLLQNGSRHNNKLIKLAEYIVLLSSVWLPFVSAKQLWTFFDIVKTNHFTQTDSDVMMTHEVKVSLWLF